MGHTDIKKSDVKPDMGHTDIKKSDVKPDMRHTDIKKSDVKPDMRHTDIRKSDIKRTRNMQILSNLMLNLHLITSDLNQHSTKTVIDIC